ncbi:MAG: hypothetical protein ACLQEQ_00750 [Nitrososphaerales archaeon]
MSERPYAIVLLLVAAAAAVVSWNPLTSVLVAGCAALLVVGFVWKRILPTLLAGLMAYPALAFALTSILPAAWSYLASGLFAIVVCERLTFEYEVSAVLGSRTGIDAEARSLVSEVSRAHTRKMAVYVALAGLVIAASILASAFTVYASELIAAAMLLMLAIYFYATR